LEPLLTPSASGVCGREISKRPFNDVDFRSLLTVSYGRGPGSHPTGLHVRAGSHRVAMTLDEIDPDAFCSRFYKTPMTSLIC
jgi:hypothetical protein